MLSRSRHLVQRVQNVSRINLIHTTSSREFMFIPMFIPTSSGSSNKNDISPYAAVRDDILYGEFTNYKRVYELTSHQIDLLEDLHNEVNQDVERWSNKFTMRGLLPKIAITGFGTLMTSTIIGLSGSIVYDAFTFQYSTPMTTSIGIFLSLMMGGVGCGAGVLTYSYGKYSLQYAKNVYNCKNAMNEFHEEYHKILKDGRNVIADTDEEHRV